MKKIIAVILSVILLIPSFTVFADDYSNHWSALSVRRLIEEGIISGDAEGNINPENMITRAEFAKVTNGVFGFNNEADSQFPDVASDKWYARDMKIAKETGYFQGDAYGNSNPEKNISRAEACVAYARILNLDTTDTNTGFADDSSIPLWAKGAVKAMKNAKLINGYTDNTFKASNNMKRCEIFTIAAGKVNQVDAPGDVGFATSPSAGVSSSQSLVSGGGYGGGGGGGGSAPTLTGLSAPLNLHLEEGYVLKWNPVSNATEYEINVELTSNENISWSNNPIRVTAASYSLKADIEALMSADSAELRNTQERFTVSVVAKNATQTSSASILSDITYDNVFIATPDIKLEHICSAENEQVLFKWNYDNNAAYYKLEIDFNGDGNYSADEIVGDAENLTGSVSLTAEQINKIAGTHKMRVTAPSKDSTKYLSLKAQETTIELPVFGGAEETISETYNLIYNKRHYANISKGANNSLTYKLMNNLEFDTVEPIASFSGKFDGCGNTITVSNGTTSLFTSSSGMILNLNVDGSFSFTEQYGSPLVSKNTSGASIIGCINYADITTSRANCGGITAYNQGIVKSCANRGNITVTDASAASIGGIVGLLGSNTAVDGCYNMGNISGGTNIAGIVGSASGVLSPKVTNSYNAGDISASSGKTGAGILASFSYADGRSLTLSNNYNAGIIKQGETEISAANAIVGTSTAGDKISNCYYLEATGEGKTNTTSLTVAEMKNLDSFTGFDSTNIWTIDAINGYLYPQHINLPFELKSVRVAAPSYTDNKEPRNTGLGVELYLTVDANTSEIKVEVSGENGSFEKTFDVNQSGVYFIPKTEFEFSESLPEYEIKLTAIGNGAIANGSKYVDSVAVVKAYEHSRFMLAAPELDLVWIAENPDTQENNDEAYKVFWSALLEEGGLTVDSYKTEIYNGNNLLDSISGETANEYYMINPLDAELEGLTDITVKIYALNSSDEAISISAEIPVNLEFAGTTTVDNEEFKLIGNERHWGNILSGGNYLLNNNITLNTPTPLSEFAGIIDGDNKTINIVNGNASLISSTTAAAIIRNLTIDSETVITLSANNSGAFVGRNKGKLINCINKADISSANSNVGGITGWNEGTVKECKNEGNLTFTAGNSHGGIVGLLGTNTAVESCVNSGNITGVSYVGGIAGNAQGVAHPKVKYCTNSGTVKGTGSNIAGIIGRFAYAANRDLTIEGCTNTGTVLKGSDDITATYAIYGSTDLTGVIIK